MSTIVLINPFEVPQGQEEAFLKWWHEAAAYLRQAPGFLSTRLHESMDPQAKFRFVNVAEWESPQHFQAAMSSEAFQQIRGKCRSPLFRPCIELSHKNCQDRGCHRTTLAELSGGFGITPRKGIFQTFDGSMMPNLKINF